MKDKLLLILVLSVVAMVMVIGYDGMRKMNSGAIQTVVKQLVK